MPGVTQPDVVGSPDDIRNAIYMADAQATPVLTMTRKDGPAKNRLYQWQVDVPSNTSKEGRTDGKDLDFNQDHSADRAMLEVNQHMVQTPVHVGHASEKTENVAGIGQGQLMAREITKAIASQKESVEQIMCDGFDHKDPPGPETRGYFSWLQSEAQSTRPVPNKHRTPEGQIYTGAWDDLTEEDIEDIMEELFQTTSNGDQRYYGFFGISLKRKVSDWSVHMPNVDNTTQTRERRIEAQTLSNIINILEFDGGTIEIHKCRNLNTKRTAEGGDPSRDVTSRRSGLIIKEEDTFLKFNEEFEFYPNENKGGGDRGFVSTIFYNCIGNPQCHGVIKPQG